MKIVDLRVKRDEVNPPRIRESISGSSLHKIGRGELRALERAEYEAIISKCRAETECYRREAAAYKEKLSQVLFSRPTGERACFPSAPSLDEILASAPSKLATPGKYLRNFVCRECNRAREAEVRSEWKALRVSKASTFGVMVASNSIPPNLQSSIAIQT